MMKYVRSISLTVLLLMLLTGTAKAYSDTPREVHVKDMGNTTKYLTQEKTVGEFLESKSDEIEALGENDKLNLSLDELIVPNYVTKIEITRSMNIHLVIDGKEETVNIPAGQYVGNVVQDLESTYGCEFEVSMKRSAALEDGQTLELKTITVRKMVREEAIAYETITKEDDTLEVGKQELMQAGAEGTLEMTFEVRLIDGEIVDEKLVDEKVVANPVSAIVHIGTKVPAPPATRQAMASMDFYVEPETPGTEVFGSDGVLTIATPNGTEENLSYSAVYTMNASAYTAGPESTGKSPGMSGYGITASGMRAQHGVVAVDPNLIPLGTRLYIEGYGHAIAGDTGGSIKGKKIDLFYDSVSDCYAFGRRDITVYVLAE